MKHTGFWNLWSKYRKIADESSDYFIKSLKYHPESPERKICLLYQLRKTKDSLPFLDELITYLEQTDDVKLQEEHLAPLIRLRELELETENDYGHI